MKIKKLLIIFGLTLFFPIGMAGYHVYQKQHATQTIAQWEQAVQEREPITKEYHAIQTEIQKYEQQAAKQRASTSSSQTKAPDCSTCVTKSGYMAASSQEAFAQN